MVAAVCVVAVVGLGVRYLWLRDQRRHTEQTVAALARTTSESLALLRRVQVNRAVVNEHNDLVRADRDTTRAFAASLHAELSRARADTTAAGVDAYVSGTEANNLRVCLTGVSQALNQLAVGDGGSVASLQAVDTQCRAAGIT